MADEKIIIEFDGDINALKTKLTSTDKQVSKLQTAAKGVGKALATTAKVAAVGFGALTAAVTTSIAVFREQEQAEIRTKKTIEATGGAAGLAAEEIFKMASELQNVTTYGDETIIAGQNMLLTFRNIGKDVFPRVTEAMLDMSTAMGTDLQSSAIQLGKALNDPVTGISALTRVGITFTDAQKESIKTMQEAGDTAGAQTVILKELENQFGGVSRAATEGTGAFIQTKNILGDIVEEIGRAVLPAVESLNDALLDVLKDSDNIVNQTIKGIGDAIAQEFEIGGVKTMSRLWEVNEQLEVIGNNIETTRKNLKERPWWTSLVPDSAMNEKLKLNLEKQTELIKEQTLLNKQIAEKGAKDTSQARLNKLKEGLEAEKQQKVEAALEEAEVLNKVTSEIFQDKYDTRASQLDALSQLVSENLTKNYDAEREVAKDDIKAQIKENQLRMKEEVKYGKSLAAAKAFFRSEEMKGTMTTLDALASMTDSGNKTIGRIAKTAAITRAIINTAQGVTSALAEVPYPLNFAAAAAVGVAGALQVSKISSTKFAKGGLVEGGVAGRDSVPAMMQQGELVVPRQNFEEVIGSIRAQRASEEVTGGSSQPPVPVEISFRDNAGEFIEATILERRVLGTGAV